MTAFDTKRWLCEDTIHTHSHGHKDTIPNSKYMNLANKSYIKCIVDAGIYSHDDLPRTSLLPERLESDSDCDSGSESDPHSLYWDCSLDGFSPSL